MEIRRGFLTEPECEAQLSFRGFRPQTLDCMTGVILMQTKDVKMGAVCSFKASAGAVKHSVFEGDTQVYRLSEGLRNKDEASESTSSSQHEDENWMLVTPVKLEDFRDEEGDGGEEVCFDTADQIEMGEGNNKKQTLFMETNHPITIQSNLLTLSTSYYGKSTLQN